MKYYIFRDSLGYVILDKVPVIVQQLDHYVLDKELDCNVETVRCTHGMFEDFAHSLDLEIGEYVEIGAV